MYITKVSIPFKKKVGSRNLRKIYREINDEIDY